MSIVKVNSAQIGQSVTATNNFCWYQPSSPDGTVRLGNGNAGSVTDLVTVNSSGNVGIGTNPTSGMLLNIGGTTGASTNSMIGLSYTNTSSQLRLTWNNAGAAIIGIGGDSSGNIILGTSASLLGTSPTALATLTQSGNLGLGVTPSGWATIKPLQIGNASFSAVNDECYLMSNAYYDGSSFKRISASHGPTQYFQYAGAHQWLTAAVGAAGSAISFTQAMTLDASGNLLVGTTGLDTANGNGVTLQKYGNGAYITIAHTTGASSGEGFVAFFRATSQIGNISQNGTTGVLYNITSDQRLKTDKGVATDTSVIDNTVVHDFEWKVDGSVDRGVFAQEAHKVKPSAVTEGTDELNEDGTPVHPWGVDYSKYVPDLIVYCQQLRAELNELKAKVNA